MFAPNRLKALFMPLVVLTMLGYNLSCNSQDTGPALVSSDHRLLKAPRFILKDLAGSRVSSQKFVGKITVINFWATWCVACRMEIPDLNKLYKDYKDRGVEIIGISLDSRGADDVIPFIKKIPIDYLILIGNRRVSDSFGGIIGLPTTYIIDRDWRIYQKHLGLMEKATLEHDLNQLLARDLGGVTK